MDYLKLLLELIKAKSELREKGFICLSLQEIANKWGINVPINESTGTVKDFEFLIDVVSAFRKLEENGLIRFGYVGKDIYRALYDSLPTGYRLTDVLDEKNLHSISDRVCFNIIGNIDDYLAKTKELVGKKMVKKEKEGQPDQTNKQGDIKPYVKVDSGIGYFKFFKKGENIKIGGKDTRSFRLLQCLCEPYFGIQKTVEAIFEAMRRPEDKNDNDLLGWGPQRKTKMLTLINYSKKELQKNKKLQGKIKYKLDSQKNNMWLELEG
jgi:hypothetical protein